MLCFENNCMYVHIENEFDIQDFKELQNFLSPKGTLLNGIYKLCTDPYLKYDFPVACLPVIPFILRTTYM